jgi:hypothetical protein
MGVLHQFEEIPHFKDITAWVVGLSLGVYALRKMLRWVDQEACTEPALIYVGNDPKSELSIASTCGFVARVAFSHNNVASS